MDFSSPIFFIFLFFFLIFFLLAPQPLTTTSLSFLSFFLLPLHLLSHFFFSFLLFFLDVMVIFSKKKKKIDYMSSIYHWFIGKIDDMSPIFIFFDKFIDFFCFHMDVYSNLDLSTIFRCITSIYRRYIGRYIQHFCPCVEPISLLANVLY